MKIIASTPLVALLSVPSLANAQGSTTHDEYQVRDIGAPISSNDMIGTSLLVAGENAPVGVRPYVTGVRSAKDDWNFCGGSLITTKHVLTASHCVEAYIRWVSIGSYYANGTQDGEQIRVVSIMNHPNYRNGAQFTDDFVVLELERASSYQPVKLAAADDSDFKEGDEVTLLGWGRTGENDTQAYELQQEQLILWNQKKCAETLVKLNPINVVDDTMLCAGSDSGKSACYGDSGGPLIKKSSTGEDILIGVVSWGERCGVEGSPSVFGRVSRVRSWIESLVNGSCF